LVILPDSIHLTQNVQHVLDLKSNEKLDFDLACDLNIIDLNQRKYLDTRTNKHMSLFEALSKNYIKMREEIATNYQDYDFNSSKSGSQMKINDNYKINNALSLSNISTVFNPNTGEQIDLNNALKLGLFDAKKLAYVIDATTTSSALNSNRLIDLEEAVDKGLVILRNNTFDENYKFLRIIGIINPATKKEMNLSDAIEHGFLDYVESEFHDPLTGRTLTLLDAYDKGYLKIVESSPNNILNLPNNNNNNNNSKNNNQELEKESKVENSNLKGKFTFSYFLDRT
jgi:hypothetical protein